MLGLDSSTCSIEDSVFGKSYHPIYQFVNDHEYVLAPLTGAIAGGIIGSVAKNFRAKINTRNQRVLSKSNSHHRINE